MEAANDPVSELYPKIRSELETAITLGDKSTHTILALAVVSAKTGDLSAATEILDRIIESEPSNIDARLMRGHLQFDQGNYSGAVTDLDVVYKAQPSADLASAISRAYLKLNKGGEALNIFADYLRRDPGNEKILISYVNLLAESGKGDEALNAVQAFLTNHKNSAPALIVMGDIFAPKQPEKAVEFYSRARDLETDDIDLRVKLGSALVRSKQPDKGLPLLQSAVRVRPDDYTTHANLATALFSLSRYVEATVEYKWIVSARPQQAIGYYFLAVSLDKQQEYEQAEPIYVMFLKLADTTANKNEIETVNFRLPGLRRLISEKKGKQHQHP